MSPFASHITLRNVLVCMTLAFAMVSVTPAPAGAAFQMGLQQDGLLLSDKAGTTGRDMKQAGASVVRISLRWNSVAVGCRGRSIAQLRQHGAACYNWTEADRAVRAARTRNMRVIASITGVPDWANNGTNGNRRYFLGTGTTFARVNKNFGAFAFAAGRRYGDNNLRIHYWTIWNEPNSKFFWQPFLRSGPNSGPRLYARLYHNGASNLKRAKRGHLVAAGPTGPKSSGLPPVTYIRAFQAHYGRMSNARRNLDAFAHNAYSGGKASPYRRVLSSPNVGVGNLRDLFRTLDSHASTRGRKVWVTEFAYETNPPDRRGTSLRLQSQWLAEAMDVFSSSGRVPIAIWYVLRDPRPAKDFQSGLMRSNGAAKPSYNMYRRPVAARTGNGSSVRLWGKTNAGPARSARLEYSFNGRKWTRVPSQRSSGSVRTARFRVRRTTFFRMRDSAGKGPARRVAG